MEPYPLRRPLMRLLPCTAALFVLSLWTLGGAAGDTSPEPGEPAASAVAYSGTVLKRDDAMLTIRSEADGKRQTFVVAADTQVTLDGTAAALADLQPGHFVKVTADRAGDKRVATLIEAVTREEKPDADESAGPAQAPLQQEAGALEVVPEVFEGRVLMAGPEHLSVAVNGDHEMFTVGPNAQIVKDGQPTMLADLAKQDFVRITAERDGENLVVLTVEARSSH